MEKSGNGDNYLRIARALAHSRTRALARSLARWVSHLCRLLIRFQSLKEHANILHPNRGDYRRREFRLVSLRLSVGHFQ